MRYISEELMTEYLKLMIEKAELVIRRSTSCTIYTQIKIICKKSVVMQSEAKHLECSHVDAREILHYVQDDKSPEQLSQTSFVLL